MQAFNLLAGYDGGALVVAAGGTSWLLRGKTTSCGVA